MTSSYISRSLSSDCLNIAVKPIVWRQQLQRNKQEKIMESSKWLTIIAAAFLMAMLTKQGGCQEQPEYCKAFIAINEATTEEKQVETVTSIFESISPEISEVLMLELSSNTTMMSNDSISQVAYEHLAASFGVEPTPTGYSNYIEAVNEISLAQAEACSNTSFVPTPDLVSQLAGQFETMFLAEDQDLSGIRSVFGKLLCLKSRPELQRKKRQIQTCKGMCPNEATEELSKAQDICEFFLCLILKYEIEEFGRIFGVVLDVSGSDDETLPTCLAFAIDFSGSMAEELDAAKQIIRGFLVNDATFNTKLCYILVAFSRFDSGSRPHVEKPQIVYITNINYKPEDLDKLNSFNNYITNLQLAGGGGGPEYSLNGMLAALNATQDGNKLMTAGSQLIVLTDEPTENTELTATVIQLANEQKVCIHFFLRDAALEEESFQLIAKQTNGTTIEEFTSIGLSEFILKHKERPCIHSNPSKRSTELSGMVKRQIGFSQAQCKVVYVSSFAYFLTLSIFSQVNDVVTAVTRPNGTTTQINIRFRLGTLSEANPVEGEWKVCSNLQVNLSLEIIADQKIVFDTSIVFVNEGSENPSSIPPPLCTSSRIALLSSQSSKISYASLNLINEDGGHTRRITLKKCDGFFVSDVITFARGTSGTYNVQLTGHDAKGVAFTQDTRHRVVLDESRSVDYELTGMGNNSLDIGVNDTLNLSFYLYNPGEYSTQFVFASSSVIGFKKEVNPTVVMVTPGERAEISFTVRVDRKNVEKLSHGSSYRFALFGSNGCRSVSASKTVVFSHEN